MRVVAKVTHTFNDFGDGGFTYKKGRIYKAEQFADCGFSVHHPDGGELAFRSDFYDYFRIINQN